MNRINNEVLTKSTEHYNTVVMDNNGELSVGLVPAGNDTNPFAGKMKTKNTLVAAGSVASAILVVIALLQLSSNYNLLSGASFFFAVLLTVLWISAGKHIVMPRSTRKYEDFELFRRDYGERPKRTVTQAELNDFDVTAEEFKRIVTDSFTGVIIVVLLYDIDRKNRSLSYDDDKQDYIKDRGEEIRDIINEYRANTENKVDAT